MAFVGDVAYTLTYAVYADKLPAERASVYGMGRDEREPNCPVLGSRQTAFHTNFVTFQDF